MPPFFKGKGTKQKDRLRSLDERGLDEKEVDLEVSEALRGILDFKI